MEQKNKEQKQKEKEMKIWWKEQVKLASKFRLSANDIHNLYDLFYMADTHGIRETLKLNKMEKWYNEMFDKLDKICLKDIYDERTKTKKH